VVARFTSVSVAFLSSLLFRICRFVLDLVLNTCITSTMDCSEWIASHPFSFMPKKGASNTCWVDFMGLKTSLTVAAKRILGSVENRTTSPSGYSKSLYGLSYLHPLSVLVDKLKPSLIPQQTLEHKLNSAVCFPTSVEFSSSSLALY
jgi:hypothetical protein